VALLHATVPESDLLAYVSFAPYCTTVPELSVND
jgi:hypothetical protein